MNFNGTILITDPCYISKRDDWGRSFDYINSEITNNNFSDYIWKSTGIGDGLFRLELSNQLNRLNSSVLGTFSVDSGNFCIIYLKEALKYNPEFIEKYETWCYTIIPNFKGSIEIVNNKIIGKGNKSFYSI